MTLTASESQELQIITVPMDDDQIRKIAHNISLEGKSWNELVWLFAESELRLAAAFASRDFLSVGDVTRAIHLYAFKFVDVYPFKIKDHPSVREIRKLAEIIAAQNPPAQELHWFIAERTYAFNKIKEFVSNTE